MTAETRRCYEAYRIFVLPVVTMGRTSTSKSERRSRHDEEVDDNRQQQHRHRQNDRQDNHGKEACEAFPAERDRHQDRKKHEKKSRRDRSQRRLYSSDESDVEIPKSSKNHRRKHSGRRSEDVDVHRENSRKSKKRRNSDVDDVKQKKSKKSRSQTADPNEMQLKSTDKSKLFSLGERLGRTPDVVLDPEKDYFAQNQRFRIFLYREYGLTFDELSSHDARQKFKDFVQKYNVGDLEEGYYAPNVPIEALNECPSTRHQWSLKITQNDSQNLQILQEGVRKQTEYQATEIHPLLLKDNHSTHQSQARSGKEDQWDHNSGDTAVNSQRDEPNNRVANRRLREHVQTTIEELTGGRKEGRERQIEKRQERAAKIHGASKYEQDMVELDDATLYGGNTDDEFRRLAAASRKRAAAQEAKKEERILELQRKEQEKQNAMLQMLGLSHKIGQSKIEIQPRNDPPDTDTSR
jgi:hypothetical protein